MKLFHRDIRKKRIIFGGIVFFPLFFIMLIVNSDMYNPYIVNFDSMNPTIMEFDLVMISMKDDYIPKKEDVIVFHSPIEDDLLIKRVIAVGKDTVEIINGDLYVENVLIYNEYNSKNLVIVDFNKKLVNLKFSMPKNTVFVLGDNRDYSIDSLFFGPISINKIIGKAEIIYWPINHIKMIK